MEIGKSSLLCPLLEFDRRQFIVPIYQRKYKWTNEQCLRLIDDVVKAGKTKKEHFTGTIIYHEPTALSFKKAYLVDGQQRVTTILLMIKALNLISSTKKDEDPDYNSVYNDTHGFLFADKSDPKKGLKLSPSKNDEKAFTEIITGKSYEDIINNPLIAKGEDDHLFNNFKTIYNRFLELCTDGKTLRNTLYKGMLSLTIAEMSLTSEDDPQEIFESINSLGVKLSNADLIRNYLLMSNPNQKELYEQYWEIIQDTYIKENNMESFVFNYLMMRKSYAINYDDIYKKYVEYANDLYHDKDIDKEELLKDLYNVAEIYQVFIRNTVSYSATTNMLMQELRDMNQTTAYPFLMKAFLDKAGGIITEEELDKVINLIIIYLVRRTICGVPTHSLRGFMLNLYNRVFKVEANKKRYYEALYAFLSQLETTDRLRTITEVSEALQTAELYKNVKFATYLLYKIENGRYPKVYSEFTLANQVSVEHIMPQTLTDEWIAMLGNTAEEIHDKYLNTLGNLSLSSRSKNSSMSNDSFESKKAALMESGSKFTELNKDITKEQTTFGEKEIKAREERLSEIVCSQYDLGSVNTEGIKFDDYEEIICTTECEEVFRSATPIGYKLFDKEYPVDSYSKIIQGVAKALYEKSPEKMRELATNNFNPWSAGDGCICFSSDDNDKGLPVAEDIRVNVSYFSYYSIQFTTLLMQQFGIDASQLIVYLKKDTIKNDSIPLKKKRVVIIRNVLTQLAEENQIIYNPKEMPKSDSWIKFQTKEQVETFPFDGLTKWDGEQFPSISYFEYHVSSNTIVLTLKALKKNSPKFEALIAHKDDLQLNDDFTGTYCHLKKYPVDYKSVFKSKDKEKALKAQFESILTQIKADFEKIKTILN